MRLSYAYGFSNFNVNEIALQRRMVYWIANELRSLNFKSLENIALLQQFKPIPFKRSRTETEFQV